MSWLAVGLMMMSTVAGADSTSDDTIRVLSLTDAPPIAVELVIRVDGKKPSEEFGSALGRMILQADRNQDGTLTTDEARGAVMTPGELRLFPGTVSNAPPELTPDTMPRDGIIQRAELQQYLRRLGLSPVGLELVSRAANPGPSATRGPAALFERLDTSGDGKLASEELEQALEVLGKLDRDDDETLSVAELQSLTVASPDRAAMPDPAATPAPFLSSASGESVARMTRRLMETYDIAPRDQRLSPTEIKFVPQDFQAFDVDGDGQLDQAELRLVISDLTPRLSLQIDVVTGAVDASGEMASTLRQSDEGARHLPMGKSELRFVCRPSDPPPPSAVAAGLMQLLDRNANGYLEPAELPDDTGLGISFASLDADQNQKIFPEELEAALTTRLDLAQSRSVIRIAEQGGTLFEILDADRDGRLARREVRGMAQLLTVWDADGDGLLSADEIPRQYAISVARGSLQLPVASRPADRGSARSESDRPGPRWFVRMDRNRDGEVSRREFLAELSLFERLDRNSDGAIDGEEALRARQD